VTRTELAEFIRLLPGLDLTWPAERQAQWWTWLDRLSREVRTHDRGGEAD
jgi:hypothetical protein